MAKAAKGTAKKAAAKKPATKKPAAKKPAAKKPAAKKPAATRPAPRPTDSRPATAIPPDGHLRIEGLTAAKLVEARATLEALRGTEVPQSVLPRPDNHVAIGFAPLPRALIDPALIDLALELGIPLQIPPGEPESYRFSQHLWSTREDELAHVSAHPWFGRVLESSFVLPREERDANVGTWFDRADRVAALAPMFDALGESLARRVAAWTLGAFEEYSEWLEALCRPVVFRRAPRVADVVRGLDIATMFGAQLRAGSMDEWGWPAQDEALDRLGAKPEFVHSGPPPYRVYYSRETKRVVACGPDGVVFDRAYEAPYPDLRSLWFLGGDVLACSYPTLAQWVDAKVELEAPPYGFYQLATGDGSAITRSGDRVRPGTSKIPAETARGTERLWFDGARFYGISMETSIGAALGVLDGKASLFTFDPDTGKRSGAALPAWFTSLLDDDSRLFVTSRVPHLQPVPVGAEASPLGATSGFGGAALVQRRTSFEHVGIDGRRGPGLVPGGTVGALMTFPERSGFYPVITSNIDLGVAMPDGTPLVPLTMRGYWQTPSPMLELPHWYVLRPRDPAGSRALAACTDEKARAILDGGADDAAVRRVLPEITHARLVAAIAALAKRANEQRAIVERIRGHLVTAIGAVESNVRDGDAKALATVLRYHAGNISPGHDLGQQMLDVSRYLFSAERDDATPARSDFPWERLFARAGEVLYRALASGTPKEHREQLVAVLRLWAQTGFPEHLPRIRTAVLAVPPESALLTGIDRRHRDRLLALENRYFVRLTQPRSVKPSPEVLVVEATRDARFRLPPGATLVEEIAVDTRFGRAAIDTALRLAAERERVEHDPAMIELVARETGLSPTAATLLWSAGYEPWLVGDAARERLKIERSALDAAERELKGKNLGEIYQRAMPADPAQLFTIDGAAQLARAWNEST